MTGTEGSVRIRRPKMSSWLGLQDVMHGPDKPEATTEPWPASAEAKGMPGYTKWRQQIMILPPTVWHIPILRLHVTPGTSGMPGEKDRKECKGERSVGQLTSIQKRLNLKLEVTSFPLMQFSST